MNLKVTALLTASFIGAAGFVGCSCSRSVENQTDDLNMIDVNNDFTTSSAETTTTTTETEPEFSEEETSTTSRTAFTYEIISDAYTTSKTLQVHYVGDPNQRPGMTTKPVVITTTAPPTTTTTTTTTVATEPPLVTQNMPDGIFNPASDLTFTANQIVLRAGDLQNSLASYADSVTDAAPVHGGTGAYAYYFGNDYHVISEAMTKPDGAYGDFITEIVLKSDKVCTNKGIKIGSMLSDVYAAYGIEKCLNDEPGKYRYKTDDGYILEFTSDGVSVTGIRYYMGM